MDGAVRRTEPVSPDTRSLTGERRSSDKKSPSGAPSTRLLKQSQTGGRSIASRVSSQRTASPGKTKKLGPADDLNALSLASNSVITLSEPSLSELPDRKVDQTKYVFYITKLACRIEVSYVYLFVICDITRPVHRQDHENNIFDIDLFNPLQPLISLAGEVDGLKPRAITESFMEPRTFIVDRTADAIEVVRCRLTINLH